MDLTWILFQTNKLANSLEVQWLALHAFTAKGLGSIPGQGTKIPPAVVWPKEKCLQIINAGKGVEKREPSTLLVGM